MMAKYYFAKNNKIESIETRHTAERLKELRPEYRNTEFYTTKKSVPTPEGYKLEGDNFVPTADTIKERERQEAKARLAEIDKESVRPLRAKIAGTHTQADTDKLAALEAEAEKLRAKINAQ